ncbi:hypothetical protein [Chryseobacterium sp. 3008163]|uniref:hypothetical protein n=1 Tax=Chryseobacterium sp. 3008163 TaxID=2478663 RepID=UPI001E3A02B6|nr:hypothetical protein [Chryseobacterium sp. 3008163]
MILAKAPRLHYSQNQEVYLLIDGTYFSNEICLLFSETMLLNKPNFTELQMEKHYAEMKEDLENILKY